MVVKDGERKRERERVGGRERESVIAVKWRGQEGWRETIREQWESGWDRKSELLGVLPNGRV